MIKDSAAEWWQTGKKCLSKTLLSLTNIQYEQPFHHSSSHSARPGQFEWLLGMTAHDIKRDIILDEVFCSASILFF